MEQHTRLNIRSGDCFCPGKRAAPWPLAGLLALCLLAGPLSKSATAQSVPQEPVPLKAVVLQHLLKDPEVRLWLEQQNAGTVEAAEQPVPAPAPSTFSALLDTRAAAIRRHIAMLAEAVPLLPAELRRIADAPGAELTSSGPRVLLYFLAILAIGFGAEWLFRRSTRSDGSRPVSPGTDSVGDRLRGLATRAVVGLGRVIAFSMGAVGAFLLFDWPPVTREIVLEYLAAFICLRVALAAAHLLFAPSPGDGELRIIPMNDDAARFWMTWTCAFAAWFAFGFATVDLLSSMGFAPEHRRIVAYALGLGLLAIALNVAWRRPRPVEPDESAAAQIRTSRRAGRMGAWLLTIYLLALWSAWVTSALNLFWLALIGGVLLLLVRTSQRAVSHILRTSAAASDGPTRASIGVVCLERGIRVALLIGAVLLLAHKWQIDFAALTEVDTPFVRLIRGVVGAIVVALLAGFAWDVAKAAIAQKIAETSAAIPSEAEAVRRRARLRTLLPIVRTATLITLIVTAAMMALASLGIEIGPLIAGAGVFGLALGFGAQTLVRDVISGMFYLLDDAFRVGEYIESGNYKGTVESFTLRTVKLRHHRGPIYTVPFGVLGAVKNMSRDWVIDKLTVSVDYGTDLDRVKKLIKQVGKTLVENPEFAPHILEPLKMQGIEQFSDYGIQIRMKMTTRPGEQFVIRRAAYSLIKKIFDGNGVRFASPTVQVSGETATPAAAAARQALTLQLAGSEAR